MQTQRLIPLHTSPVLQHSNRREIYQDKPWLRPFLYAFASCSVDNRAAMMKSFTRRAELWDLFGPTWSYGSHTTHMRTSDDVCALNK